MPSVFFDPDISDDERRRCLYAGEIVILSPTPGTAALVALAKAMLEEAFAPHDPRLVPEHMTPEQVAAILAELKPKFIHHPQCKQFIPTIMRENGVDVDKLYFDVPRLRSAYPSDFGADVPDQLVDPNNAMGFYPRYATEPVKNNSEIYNYYEWNTKNRASAAEHVRGDSREQPKPQQELEPITIRYLPPPGVAVVFSARNCTRQCPTRPASHATASISAQFTSTIWRRSAAHRISIRAPQARPSATTCGHRICSTCRRRSLRFTMTAAGPRTGSFISEIVS
jgi:hypothetical protein